MKRNLVLGILVAMALVGCGKKDAGSAKGEDKKADKADKADDPAMPKKVAGGCNNADTGVCTFNADSDPKLCESMSGKFIAGACPKENAVPGTCTCKSEYNTEVKTYYTTSAAKYTADTAKEACVNQQCTWAP